MTYLFSVEDTYIHITPSIANVLVSKCTKEAVHKIKTENWSWNSTKEKADLFLCMDIDMRYVTEANSQFQIRLTSEQTWSPLTTVFNYKSSYMKEHPYE